MPLKKECIKCSKVFFVKKSLSRVQYCSRECLDTHTVDLTCHVCDNVFTARAIKAKTAKYCSDACRVKSGPCKISCEVCKKLFSVRSNRALSARFCSQKCSFSTMRSEITCLVCSKVFTKPKSSKRILCSIECTAIHLSDRVTLTCSICESEYLVKKSRERASKYCSMKCSYSSQEIDRNYEEPPRIEGARWIQLGHNKFSLVDVDQFDDLNKYLWSEYKGYAHRNSTVDSKVIHVAMHRQIIDAPPLQEVDHINGDTLDNRRMNLRFATRSENAMNRVDRGDGSSSGYRGVYLSRSGKYFFSTIKVNQKQLYLGSYNYIVSAAKAYDDAAREYFGEFARLNFPKEGEQKA